MRRAWARTGAWSCGLLLAAASAGAQTNDHFFRSWVWVEDPATPRAAGLAGALAAVADDASATLYNPAGLARLPKAEVAASLLSRRAGSAPVGDTLSARTGIGFAAAAAPLGARFVVAGSISEPHARRTRLDETLVLPDGISESGGLEATLTDLSLALAWRVTPRLHLGGRVTRSRLSLEGQYSRDPASGPAELRVDTSGQASDTLGAFGLVFEPVRRVRLAVGTASGLRWRFSRRAVSPLFGEVLDEGSGFEVRRPAVATAALAVEPSLKLRLTAQVDRVRYGQIQSGLVIGLGAHARADYALDDGWEPRLGVEISLPRRAASFQLRGGVHWPAPASLRYVGTDPTERVVFPGASRQAVGGAGASIVTRSSWRLDLGGQFGGDRSLLAAGLAVRF